MFPPFSRFFKFVGIVSVDVSKQSKADELFPEIIHELLHEPGQSSRILTIKLGIQLAKELHLDGSRGDATLLAKTLRIRIVQKTASF